MKITKKIMNLLSLMNILQEYFLLQLIRVKNSSIKGAEQLRVPSPWLVFLMLDIVKMVCSIMENSGDNEGTFPSRGELVWFLLIHSKNQVSLLKGSAPHVSGVESTQVLLINGRPD